ncbi:porin family protein [Maribacter antarcticus]|uniref:hypothetical protein n=1 Tax=Maribacter antarcticus TaxID=505250 RepID=UPI0012ECABE8|nr:hypothetical protein [Maribacter antarcticus]
MKRLLLSLTMIVGIYFTSYSQVTFEEGYYINNQNQRTECLIKNYSRRSNPTDIMFRSSTNNNTVRLSINDVKQFEIYNSAKFIRVTADIDQSSQSINTIDKSWKPILETKTVFVRELVKGPVNLYSLIEDNRELFFFSKDSSRIKQLIFKRYLVGRNNFGENNTFREQLLDNLKCPEFSFKKMQEVVYIKKSLQKIVKEYNTCVGQESSNVEKKREKTKFNLNLRPRMNYSSTMTPGPPFASANLTMNQKQSFGFGIETEIILPINKNKWSIIAEAAYQEFSNQNIFETSNVSGGIVNSTLAYSSIEIPLGVRHYMFLSKNSKLFINMAYTMDFTIKTEFEFTRADETVLRSGDFRTFGSFSGGFGYKYLDKFSLEFRLLTLSHRTILFADSEFNSYSVIFGYTLF